MSRPKKSEFLKIREKRGLSVQAAADLFEVTPRTVRNWDRKGAPKLVMRLFWGMDGRLECLDPRWKGFKIGVDGKLRGPNGFVATSENLSHWQDILVHRSCHSLGVP